MLYPIFIVGVLLLHCVQCSEVKYARFNLAQRVDDCDSRKEARLPIGKLLDSEAGREELMAIYNHSHNFKKTVSAYEDYVLLQDHSYIKQFSRNLSLGLVSSWPRYCFKNGKIRVYIEKIRSRSPGDNAKSDIGPPTPEFEELDNKESAYKPLDYTAKWTVDTPEEYQDSNQHELDRVLPLPLMVKFYNWFSAVWKTLGSKERRVASPPFRILKRTSEMAQKIAAGRLLRTEEFSDDHYRLKKHVVEEFGFSYDVKKILFWAPGLLYFRFKNRVMEEKRHELWMIMGSERYSKAEELRNRLESFLNSIEKRNTEQEAVEEIKKDDNMYDDIMNLMRDLVYFGMERNQPYPNDYQKWTLDDKTKKWKLKPSKGLEKLKILDKLCIPQKKKCAGAKARDEYCQEAKKIYSVILDGFSI